MKDTQDLDGQMFFNREPFARIVCFSGGESSALVAIEVQKRYPDDILILLNSDIKESSEAADIKRFKREMADYLKTPITFANMQGWDTLDQFDVVVKVGAITNITGDALCTSYMKTAPFQEYLKYNFPTKNCVIYYGFDKDEPTRITRRARILGEQGYRSDYPLAFWERTIYSTTELGITPPHVYDVFKHANCTGCLKAGKQHWYVVYCTRPDIWERAKWAEDETGYALFKEESLLDLEPLFQAMKDAGVTATERMPSGKFWSTVRKNVPFYKIYKNQDEDAKPCECVA